MHYPTLKTIPASREAVDVFRGLNQQGDIAPGEFAAMENMTAQSYPQASTCRASQVYLPGACPQGILAKEALCFVENGHMVVGDNAYNLGLGDGEKQLVSMGAYVLILPDKKYFNTADPEDFGSIEQVVEQSQWKLEPCDSSGVSRNPDYVSDTQPDSPAQGEIWYDHSGETPKLRVYNAELEQWGALEGYVKATLENGENPNWPYAGYFTDCFATGDQVRIQILGSALVDDEGQPLRSQWQKEKVLEDGVWGLAAEVALQVVDGLTVIFPGLLPESLYLGNTLRFDSRMPDLDFVFECGNRLWGCRYGDQDGKFVNEIYASRLGDFRNWTSYQGVSTDAWRASVGTDGPFTGAMNYLGYPLFFKENCIHRVYGSIPSEYRIQTTPGAGVASGCSRSLCLLGDAALYLGNNGVCAYDGALPSPISRALQGLTGPAVAGVLGEDYYLSTPQGLYVYHSRRNLWHRRSPIGALQMCAYGNRLFWLGDAGDLMVLDAGEEAVDFYLETGILAGSEQRRIRSVCLRYALTGWGRVMVEYDSSGVWLAAGELPQTRLGWTNLPLKPRRCDHFRLKLCGHGRFRLHSVIKTLEKGSDLP